MWTRENLEARPHRRRLLSFWKGPEKHVIGSVQIYSDVFSHVLKENGENGNNGFRDDGLFEPCSAGTHLNSRLISAVDTQHHAGRFTAGLDEVQSDADRRRCVNAFLQQQKKRHLHVVEEK